MRSGLFYEATNENSTELDEVAGEVLIPGTTTDHEARLDFAERDFYQPCEMAYFDVNVFSLFAKSHLKTNLKSLFKKQGYKKKEKYNVKLIKVEHGVFTPVVLYGGFRRETCCFVPSGEDC